MQGVGGLEAVIDTGASKISAVWSDMLGHVDAYSLPASYTGGSVTPGAVTPQSRSSGYGLLPGEAAVERWSQNTGTGLTTTLAATLAWQGRRMDASGYYSIGAREYNPTAGRFLSPDPLGQSASWDLYSYAGGDPINYIDCTGRSQVQAVQDKSLQPPTGTDVSNLTTTGFSGTISGSTNTSGSINLGPLGTAAKIVIIGGTAVVVTVEAYSVIGSFEIPETASVGGAAVAGVDAVTETTLTTMAGMSSGSEEGSLILNTLNGVNEAVADASRTAVSFYNTSQGLQTGAKIIGAGYLIDKGINAYNEGAEGEDPPDPTVPDAEAGPFEQASYFAEQVPYVVGAITKMPTSEILNSLTHLSLGSSPPSSSQNVQSSASYAAPMSGTLTTGF